VSTTAVAKFNPRRCSTFRVLEHRYDPDTSAASFSYALDDLVFEEIVTFPPGAQEPSGGRARAFDAVLSLLHLIAGVSYYKAAVPPRIELDSLPGPAAASLVESVYTLGLGEFAYRNGLDTAIRASFPHGEARAPVALSSTAGSLVPVGGGKDSIVALEIARAAGPVTLFSVGDHPPIARTAEVSELPRLVANRQISPLLLELNSCGALNGHVPVTAIVSLIALATAVLHGYERVVMANERSASQGNLHWDGIEVNHQWSKGYAFENGLREVLASEVTSGVDCFSLLRPAGELTIARAFAAMPAYHNAFTSCNSVFRLAGKAGQTWCRDCPKCRFVFLALAPFLSPGRLVTIFGADLLSDTTQIPGFMALCGFQADKPFECVGEREESLAALRLLAESPLWRDHSVVSYARETLLTSMPSDLADPEQVLRLSTSHNIPEPFMAAALASLGA
jgi:hypothetical protein